MDLVGPLAGQHVVGRFEPSVESALRADPGLVRSRRMSWRPWASARGTVPSADDVFSAALLEADERRRDPGWRSAVLQAWDRQCAFCGYDGQLAGASVGIDAAHVRWFAFDGPDALDNGLALCVLHHKLFDLGVLGLDARRLRVLVSAVFTARTTAGREVYELHGRPLTPRRHGRPGRRPPLLARRQVFKGQPLTA